MNTFKNVLLFFLMIVLAWLWVKVDQFFLPVPLLFQAFAVVVSLLMAGYFAIVRPVDIRRFSLFLSGCVALVVLVLSAIQHFILQHDLMAVWKHTLMILVIASSLPLVVGAGYAVLVKHKPR
jgi:hypothetical protein